MRLFPLALAAFIAYSTWSVSRYERFADRSWDLAIFTQAVRSYAHGHPPIAPIKGPGFDLLGDHFSPILASLAPAYRLFPSPVTLQISQAALLAVAIIPIGRAAITHLGNGAGYTIAVAYSLAWGVQTAVDADFHEVCFAVPLLAFSLEATLDRRWRRAAIWAIPLVLVKEDLGLTVAMLGAYLILQHQRRLGIGLVLFGVLASALTVAVLIPAASSTHSYAYWSAFTSGHSHHVSLALNPIKRHTLLLLAALTAIIGFRSPLLALSLPTLAWRFTSNNPSYWSNIWHYDLVLMPIIFAALIDGTRQGRTSRHHSQRILAKHAPTISVTVGVLLTTTMPLANLIHASTYRPSPRAAAAKAALQLIPNGSVVESDTGLMTRLVSRCTVYWIGDTGTVIPSAIVIDAQAGWSPAPPADPAAYAEQLHPGTRYRLAYAHQGYDVLLAQPTP